MTSLRSLSNEICLLLNSPIAIGELDSSKVGHDISRCVFSLSATNRKILTIPCFNSVHSYRPLHPLPFWLVSKSKEHTSVTSETSINLWCLLLITEIRQHLMLPSWCLWNNWGTINPLFFGITADSQWGCQFCYQS